MIHIHNNIGMNPLAWFRSSDTRTPGKSMWILELVDPLLRLLPGSIYYVDLLSN